MSNYLNFFKRSVPLLKLVQVHETRQDVHSVFGVILFTDEHPFVTKILRDPDFWKALDAISGPRWPIFAIRPHAGEVTTEIPQTGSGSSGMSFLLALPQWHEPKDNRHLLKAFEITNTRLLPMLLVFTELPSGEIARLHWRFDAGENTEECFKSLKAVAESAKAAISDVTAPNIKSNEAVFNLINESHLQFQLVANTKKALSVAKWLKDLLGIFTGS